MGRRLYSALHSYGDRSVRGNLMSQLNFREQHLVTRSTVNRLGLEYELDGHDGCVNCLEWNETGTLLLSGSDDLCICLWDPYHHRLVHKIKTHHSGNIFTVKFMAGHGENLIVSGAADCRVQLHDLHNGGTFRTFANNGGRVKRIATTPSVQDVFWVAAEDGTVMQYDLRDPCLASSQRSPPIVLLNLNAHCGPHVEVKCLAINHMRPEMLAVGCNDPYIRVYDRRNLTARPLSMPAVSSSGGSGSGDAEEETARRWASPSEWSLPECAAVYFAAGHLPSKEYVYRRSFRSLAVTYLTFSPDGTELLANCGGEQIYLFDVNRPRLVEHFRPPVESSSSSSSQQSILLAHEHRQTSNFADFAHFADQFGPSVAAVANMDEHRLADLIKERANQYYSEHKYPLSIQAYNQALSINSSSAVLWANRAAALIKRNWCGDVYLAARDCQRAIDIDADYFKAYCRLARCLHDLNWSVDALKVLEFVRNRFPADKTKSIESFYKTVKTTVDMMPTTDSSSTSSPARRRARKNSQNRSESESGGDNDQEDSSPIRRRHDNLSDTEKLFRKRAFDFDVMFSGHCNTTTDIKEANFFGSNYIVAGSDDGHFFIWDRTTTNVVKILSGDESIVNCLQPAPSTCLLATSGIDKVVRLWSPLPDDGRPNPRLVSAAWNKVAEDNQRRMNADPLEVMLQSMGYRIVHSDDEGGGDEGGGNNEGGGDSDDEDDDTLGPRHNNQGQGRHGSGNHGRIGCATS